jgi:RNA polymerase primary sigma factor
MRSDLQTTDSFRLYLDEVGRHPLLTKQDEIELSQAYEAGLQAQLKLADTAPEDPARPQLTAVAERGEWARRKMIESNLRLVVSIARRFSATGLPLGDLVQEGNLGLLRAVEKFDWRKGFKFSTYATWWIRQAIARGAADRGARAIRLPVHVDEQVGRLRRTQTRLHELLGREPSDEELAAELDMATDKVHRLKDTAQAITSLDTPIGDDGAALQDFLEDDSAVGPDELAVEAVGREALEQVLNGLPERERQVLILRFGLDSGTPRTLEEVGAVMGFSRERARQVERDALASLRSPEIRARLADAETQPPSPRPRPRRRRRVSQPPGRQAPPTPADDRPESPATSAWSECSAGAFHGALGDPQPPGVAGGGQGPGDAHLPGGPPTGSPRWASPWPASSWRMASADRAVLARNPTAGLAAISSA